MVFSGSLLSCLKEVKSIVMFDVECGMGLEPLHVNGASSQVDLRYTKLFRVPAVTSESL